MRNKARFSSLPTASGGIARAAFARALEAGVEVEPLLRSCNLSSDQIKNIHFRMPVKNQVKFLSVVPRLDQLICKGTEFCCQINVYDMFGTKGLSEGERE
jgi:hypothetical protein